MKDIDVNPAICGIFRSVTLRAAVSSWYRLHSEFVIYQESTQEMLWKGISSDSELDH